MIKRSKPGVVVRTGSIERVGQRHVVRIGRWRVVRIRRWDVVRVWSWRRWVNIVIVRLRVSVWIGNWCWELLADVESEPSGVPAGEAQADDVAAKPGLLEAVAKVGVDSLHHSALTAPGAAAADQHAQSVAVAAAVAPAGLAGIELAHHYQRNNQYA